MSGNFEEVRSAIAEVIPERCEGCEDADAAIITATGMVEEGGLALQRARSCARIVLSLGCSEGLVQGNCGFQNNCGRTPAEEVNYLAKYHKALGVED
jgi:hypothetical protein